MSGSTRSSELKPGKPGSRRCVRLCAKRPASSSFASLQTVPQPSDRPDPERMPLFRKALAQPVDVDIQRSFVAFEIVAPDILDELVARQRLAGIACQLEKQLEFLQGERQRPAVNRGLVRLAVHSEPADLHRLRTGDAVSLQ